METELASNDMGTRLELVYIMPSSESCMCSLASVSRTSYCELSKLDRLDKLDSKLTIVLAVGPSFVVRNAEGPLEDVYVSSVSLYVAETSLKELLRLDPYSDASPRALGGMAKLALLVLDEKLTLVFEVSRADSGSSEAELGVGKLVTLLWGRLVSRLPELRE